MKNRFPAVLAIVCILFYLAESCQKNASTPAASQSLSGSGSLSTAIASLQAIAVGSTTASSDASDSIYVIHACSPHSKKDTIAFSSLPSSIIAYLNTNYAGYTSQRAYAITDSSGAAAGYVVIIQYNNSHVGLKFDASGNFVTVLEQKLGRELRECAAGDSTYMHNGHPYDSTHIYDDSNDSTHHHQGDSTDHHDGDSTHRH